MDMIWFLVRPTDDSLLFLAQLCIGSPLSLVIALCLCLHFLNRLRFLECPTQTKIHLQPTTLPRQRRDRPWLRHRLRPGRPHRRRRTVHHHRLNQPIHRMRRHRHRHLPHPRQCPTIRVALVANRSNGAVMKMIPTPRRCVCAIGSTRPIPSAARMKKRRNSESARPRFDVKCARPRSSTCRTCPTISRLELVRSFV